MLKDKLDEFYTEYERYRTYGIINVMKSEYLNFGKLWEWIMHQEFAKKIEIDLQNIYNLKQIQVTTNLLCEL